MSVDICVLDASNFSLSDYEYMYKYDIRANVPLQLFRSFRMSIDVRRLDDDEYLESRGTSDVSVT